MHDKLRVGFLLDSLEVSAWWYAMAERISGSDFADISLFVVNDGPPSQAPRPLRSKLQRNWRELGSVIVRKALLSSYALMFRQKPASPDAFVRKDLSRLLPRVPVLKVRPKWKNFSVYFNKDELEQIKSQDLDVLIRVGFRILRGDILTSARYGVWSYHHGDNAINRGGPAGFWETMEGWPEMGVTLQVLTEDLDNGKVLCRSYSCTDRYFIDRNRNNAYWKAMSFIPRKLKELHSMGPEAFFEKVDKENSHPSFYSSKLYKEPGNRELARLVFTNTGLKIKSKFLHTFYFKQWGLLYALKDDISSSFWRFKRLVPPKDRFWADPCVLARDGVFYIFLEEFIYKKDRAHISVMVMDRQGNHSYPVKVIERPYHLSYPFLFESDSQLYLVPESAKNRTIELYRCVEFPWKWELQRNLMEGVRAYDTTLYRRDGKWWMFTNMVENEGGPSFDELFIFHAETLDGPWIPHSANPVISDAKSARPAGPLFERNKRLYRPSQMSYGRYGRSININEVKVLNGDEYREELVSRIEPSWSRDLISTHTLTHVPGLTMIDAYWLRRR